VGSPVLGISGRHDCISVREDRSISDIVSGKGPLEVHSRLAFTLFICVQKWLKISVVVGTVTKPVFTTNADATLQSSYMQTLNLAN